MDALDDVAMYSLNNDIQTYSESIGDQSTEENQDYISQQEFKGSGTGRYKFGQSMLHPIGARTCPEIGSPSCPCKSA